MLVITEGLKNEIKKLGEKYRLSLMLLFGSQASGKTHKESDIDIAYLSEKPLELMEEARLAIDLAPILKSNFIYVVDLRKSPPLLMKEVFDHHLILLCRSYVQYFAYLMYAARRYEESEPLFALRSEAIDRFLKMRAQ